MAGFCISGILQKERFPGEMILSSPSSCCPQMGWFASTRMWRSVDTTRYSLQQPPGTGNAEKKAVRNEESCPSSSASEASPTAAFLCLEMGEGIVPCNGLQLMFLPCKEAGCGPSCSVSHLLWQSWLPCVWWGTSLLFWTSTPVPEIEIIP